MLSLHCVSFLVLLRICLFFASMASVDTHQNGQLTYIRVDKFAWSPDKEPFSPSSPLPHEMRTSPYELSTFEMESYPHPGRMWPTSRRADSLSGVSQTSPGFTPPRRGANLSLMSLSLPPINTLLHTRYFHQRTGREHG